MKSRVLSDKDQTENGLLTQVVALEIVLVLVQVLIP